MKLPIIFAILLFLLLPVEAWAVEGRIQGGWSYVWSAYGISWAAMLAYLFRLHKEKGL